MPDGSMMEWAYSMEWIQIPLQNPMQSLVWEENLPSNTDGLWNNLIDNELLDAEQ